MTLAVTTLSLWRRGGCLRRREREDLGPVAEPAAPAVHPEPLDEGPPRPRRLEEEEVGLFFPAILLHLQRSKSLLFGFRRRFGLLIVLCLGSSDPPLLEGGFDGAEPLHDEER